MGVHVEGLSFRYPGMPHDALSEITFHAPRGRALAVLGAPGAGKSTLLRILAGLETPTAGSIVFDGQGAVGADFLRGNVSMVFQNYALMPNLSIEQNIALHRAGGPKQEVAHDVRRVAELLGLAGVLGDKARELAPSQRMRVAFARALVRRPRLLLLDEPLAHLDNTFSTDLRGDLAQAIAATGVTTVLATADGEEASSLGGPLITLVGGRLRRAPEQGAADTSAEGRLNHLPVHEHADGTLSVDHLRLDTRIMPGTPTARPHAVVRSSDFSLAALGDGLAVEVMDVTYAGGRTTVYGRCRVSEQLRPIRLEIELAGDLRRVITSQIAVRPKPGTVRLVDRETGRPIPSITIED